MRNEERHLLLAGRQDVENFPDTTPPLVGGVDTTILTSGGGVLGSAPNTTLEQGAGQPRERRQQLITEMFSEKVPPPLAACFNTSPPSAQLMVDKETFEEDRRGSLTMVDNSDVDGVLTRSNSVTLENDRNVIQHREDNISEVLPVPPSDMSCNYTRGRGRCNIHGNMGEKYVISERKWRDRGQGRGYGYVSTKKVKYRCVGEKLQKGQNSTE